VTAGLVRRATGTLRDFNEAGVLSPADVHVARRLSRLGGEDDDGVLLAVALAVRAVRMGSVCLDVSHAEATTGVEEPADDAPAALATLTWPDVAAWVEALAGSPVVAVGAEGPQDRPLRLVGELLYLDRYWRQEQVIAAAVDDRARHPVTDVDGDRLAAALSRLFGTGTAPDEQRLAVAVAAHRRLTVLAGGPGTGKTTTVARLLAALRDQPGPAVRVALAAPTGKAAARLEQAVRTADLPPADRARLGHLGASTIHRLLGFRPGGAGRFRHDRSNRLPYDLVVVDEASMVSLTLMSRLVDAVRPEARLVLVGDPDQLASVEAGAVLGDLVRRPAPDDARPSGGLSAVAARDLVPLADRERARVESSGVVLLRTGRRFEGAVDDLAKAIRDGDADGALAVLTAGGEAELVDADPDSGDGVLGLRADVVTAGTELTRAARAGDAEEALTQLDRHRLLCAHRHGPYGVARWSRLVEEWLAEAMPGYAADAPWYVGRPLILTANDYDLRLYNGDTGVVVDQDGRRRAAFRRGDQVVSLGPSRLSDVETVHALSVHRSQGSEFDRVSVVLPPPESPLLTRELLYTAVTRARTHVRVLGGADSVRAAVTRRITRASGLDRRCPLPTG
jgi:exodeoxyribonuclease V alpha subunit